jgi:hypothetical protein
VKHSLVALAVLGSIAAVPFAAASEINSWQNLIDQAAQTFDDPYRDLSYDQLEAVATVARLRARLELEGEDPRDQSATEARLADTVEALAGAGIDADWLIEQRWVVAERRRIAASAGNPEIDGAVVTLVGFIIPGPVHADGLQIGYLAPERGMCSHMPPPNPNQLIQIRSSEGELPTQIYTPVKISGTIRIDPTSESIFMVDGAQEMLATFALDLDAIEKYVMPAKEEKSADRNAWQALLKNRSSTATQDVGSN